MGRSRAAAEELWERFAVGPIRPSLHTIRGRHAGGSASTISLRHILGKPPIEVNLDAPGRNTSRACFASTNFHLSSILAIGFRQANTALFGLSERLERKAFQPVPRGIGGLESLGSPLQSPKCILELLVPPWTAAARPVVPRTYPEMSSEARHQSCLVVTNQRVRVATLGG